MKPTSMTRLVLATIGLAFSAQLVYAANAQPIPMEAENRAKMSRLKLKTGVSPRSSLSEKRNSAEDGDCSIEIGNVDTGGSALRRAPREVNIFIPEPIFQVNNRCR
ncbi:MAG: hypothetical protein KDH17_20605 [Rhodocyclaceae bacterium]|nr:hypothetical protein [Rhodocyclaceae bacterium]